jgi:PIN domain nuclease of toxin-antitoxin system
VTVRVVLLDTHVVHWWSAEPERLSTAAGDLIESAEEIAISAVSWYELAWLARHERILLDVPVRTWLSEIASDVRVAPITPAIAETAVGLPASFPGDPADRIIFATAIETGWPLVTKDRQLRRHRHPRQVTIW